MARRKHHTPERVVNLLRQIEVAVAQGKTIAVAWTIPLSDFTIGVPLATTERYLLKELPSSDVRLDSLNHYERDDPNSGWTPKQVDLDSAGELVSYDDDAPEPSAAAKQKYLPSSIGVSVLLPKGAKTLTVRISWGDDRQKTSGPGSEQWTSEDREETIILELADKLDRPIEKRVPKSGGLTIALTILPVGKFGAEAGLKDGARAISVFLVNRRTPKGDEIRDEALTFQAELHLTADQPFLERPNTRRLMSEDWDENVADLQ